MSCELLAAGRAGEGCEGAAVAVRCPLPAADRHTSNMHCISVFVAVGVFERHERKVTEVLPLGPSNPTLR